MTRPSRTRQTGGELGAGTHGRHGRGWRLALEQLLLTGASDSTAAELSGLQQGRAALTSGDIGGSRVSGYGPFEPFFDTRSSLRLRLFAWSSPLNFKLQIPHQWRIAPAAASCAPVADTQTCAGYNLPVHRFSPAKFSFRFGQGIAMMREALTGQALA